MHHCNEYSYKSLDLRTDKKTQASRALEKIKKIVIQKKGKNLKAFAWEAGTLVRHQKREQDDIQKKRVQKFMNEKNENLKREKKNTSSNMTTLNIELENVISIQRIILL